MIGVTNATKMHIANKDSPEIAINIKKNNFDISIKNPGIVLITSINETFILITRFHINSFSCYLCTV